MLQFIRKMKARKYIGHPVYGGAFLDFISEGGPKGMIRYNGAGHYYYASPGKNYEIEFFTINYEDNWIARFYNSEISEEDRSVCSRLLAKMVLWQYHNRVYPENKRREIEEKQSLIARRIVKL